jgi:serine/threonine protein kinase
VLLRIPDQSISWTHAEIRLDSGKFIIRDLGSSNGTFVNGRLVKMTPLSANDRIRLGGTEFLFQRTGQALPQMAPVHVPPAAVTKGPAAILSPPPKPAPEPVPKVLSFEIMLPAIAVGGTSTIYKARSTDGNLKNALVVLKVLLARHTQDPDFQAMFANEIELGKQLKHPNIVWMDEARTEDGMPVQVVEFASGGSLRNLIHNPPKLSFDRIYRILGECCAALKYAHEEAFPDKCIVHNDVKPENILLNGKGAVKLCDFGTAKVALVASGVTTKRFITPNYASPEQVLGLPSDRRTDIYSLCIVAYELCTGRAPFEGRNSDETMDKQVKEMPVSPLKYRKDTPPALERTIMRGLQKDPDHRPASIGVLLQSMKAD